MEEKILEVVAKVDAAGGMYAAVESGLVQRMVGEGALAFQERVESGAETIVGVNKFRVAQEDELVRKPLRPPPAAVIEAQLDRLKRYKAARGQNTVRRALDALARAAESSDENVFAQVVEAADAGVTHGEICGCLRKVYGNGAPLIVP